MYKTLFITFLLFTMTSCGEKSTKEVSFTAIIDIANATKGGIYINGYVVEIDSEKAKALNGKKVKIIGKATIVKGLEKDDKVIKQGRSKDVIHIKSPTIEIITD
jgi:hypothetical protein